MKVPSFFTASQAFFAATRQNQGTQFIPSRAPAIPLAVKSPYMNTWLEVGSNGNGNLAGNWPKFWAGAQPGDVIGDSGATTALAGLIKVDDLHYTWMGDPVINGIRPTHVSQESVEFTSQRTTFIMNVAGKVSMNVTFISPVQPNDLKRQSIVGTYLEVGVKSLDAAGHKVQLYVDTSAEWVNPTHNSDVVEWSFSDQNGIASHKSWLKTQSEFNADYPDDAAHWGNWYLSTAAISGMTYQTGSDNNVRQRFLSSATLDNSLDTNFRAIRQDWPVFAFSNNLGHVGGSPKKTLYTIVHAQKNAVLFNGANGIAPVPSLWTSYFDSDAALVEFFYKDHPTITGAIDTQIALHSHAAGGPDYTLLTTLSVRQSLAATVLTNTPTSPLLFLKEISSNGNTQTVDVIFPSLPLFLYLNPSFVKYLLEPLYINQESGRWPHTYAIHDIGANFPRAIGHEDGNAEEMPVEECGNMIIASLAYAQRAGDKEYLKGHYKIMRQWVEYLVEDSLIPGHQLSTDDFQGPLQNQTNLALKGILAISAMSEIARLTDHPDDAKLYNDIAKDYIAKWEGFAVVDGKHTSLAYQDKASHGLLYNLYADALLSLNLVPQRIYDMQTDWEIWTASITSSSTRTMFISKMANFVRETSTNRGFTDLYDTTNAK
ncbi:Six-hairpin glycosidase [Glarea lozoyensis ATCC 20868]|uniref:Six-hairpin glycosidase n=1 Tax=Glarea lozoyensis (strain ATCC 20868 / MF5171) TaxID=1116229 RepID=S3CUZ7_GLAL2|nr:Six-hairpin glycosidase [Glarea lozoyensis ATCC 20868]EPE28779.1 Six-hairpin glycosidase [Glarea lozoyensis ATCC 20868]